MTELGNKFQCSECDTKFYDLGREQAVCPQCGHEMQKEDPLKSGKASRAGKKKAKKKAASAKAADNEEE